MLRALAGAATVCAAGLALGWLWAPSLLWAVPAATLVVVTLQRLEPPALAEGRCDASASPLFTALFAGSITVVVTFGFGRLDAYAAGIVTSLPVIAAAVAMRQHRLEGHGAVHRFLDGYLSGLIGRIAFSGSFGLLVLAVPWPMAAALALAVAATVGAAVSAVRGGPLRRSIARPLQFGSVSQELAVHSVAER